MTRMTVGSTFTVTSGDPFPEGRYRFIDEPHASQHYDPELPVGEIEVYMHPERGLSYWDEGHDDSTDWAGHAPWYLLIGQRMERVA